MPTRFKKWEFFMKHTPKNASTKKKKLWDRSLRFPLKKKTQGFVSQLFYCEFTFTLSQVFCPSFYFCLNIHKRHYSLIFILNKLPKFRDKKVFLCHTLLYGFSFIFYANMFVRNLVLRKTWKNHEGAQAICFFQSWKSQSQVFTGFFMHAQGDILDIDCIKQEHLQNYIFFSF